MQKQSCRELGQSDLGTGEMYTKTRRWKKLCVLGKLKGPSVGDESEDERNGCFQNIRHVWEEKSTEPSTVLVKVVEGKGGIHHDPLVMLSYISTYFIIKIIWINKEMTPKCKGHEFTEKKIYLALKMRKTWLSKQIKSDNPDWSLLFCGLNVLVVT